MNRDNSYFRTILISVLIGLVLSVGSILIHGTDEASVRFLIRGSAKISALLFLTAFGASAMYHFWNKDWIRKLLQKRAHIGLAFAVAHTFHLGFLLWLQQSIHPVFTLAKTTSLIGGGLAYVLMYLMAITTFSKPKKILSIAQWRILHLVGGYWIYFIFFKSYLKQVMNQDRGYVIFAMLLFVLAIRLLFLFRNKQRKSNPS